MFSYEEFKEELKKVHGFSEEEIYYFVGFLFEKTNEFRESHKEGFYGLRKNMVVYIKWSSETRKWDYEIDEW